MSASSHGKRFAIGALIVEIDFSWPRNDEASRGGARRPPASIGRWHWV